MAGKQKNPVDILVNAGKTSRVARNGVMEMIGIATSSAAISINAWNSFFWATETGSLVKKSPSALQKGIADAAESLRSINASREYKKRALEKFSSGEYEEALALFTKSIDYFPFGESYLYRAIAKINTGLTVSSKKDLEKAVEFFRIEVEYSPDSAELRLNLGRSYFLMGNFEKAAKIWEALATMQPKNAKICEDIGVAFASCGRFADATSEFQNAVARDDRTGNSYYFMGMIWMDHYEQMNEAILNFNKALQINPKHADAWCGRADARFRIGHFNDAHADARIALAINPNNRVAQDLLLKTADEIGLVDPNCWKMIENNVMH